MSGGLCWCLGKYQATQNQTFKGIEASPPCSRVSILRHSNHTFFHHSLNAVNTGERIIITSNVTFPRARCHFRLLRCPLLWQTPPSPDHHCCTRFSAWRWFFFPPSVSLYHVWTHCSPGTKDGFPSSQLFVFICFPALAKQLCYKWTASASDGGGESVSVLYLLYFQSGTTDRRIKHSQTLPAGDMGGRQ